MSSTTILPLFRQQMQGALGEWNLEVRGADDKVLQVANPVAAGETEIRTYALKDTRFVPEYPFEDCDAGWRISTAAAGADPAQHTPCNYAFASIDGAFAFQRFVTGYIPVGRCQNARFNATIHRSIYPNDKYQGEGEVQLWLPESMEIAPSDPKVERLLSKNGEAFVNLDRSPLLVAFLVDKEKKSRKAEQYTEAKTQTFTMMKMKSMVSSRQPTMSRLSDGRYP